jgi:glutathione S-transferase
VPSLGLGHSTQPTSLNELASLHYFARSLARSTTDLNFFFSSPQLRPATDATDAATAGFFPALAKFLKNKDKAADAALQEDLEAKLATLDAHLASVAEETAGDDAAPLFMAGGGSIGLADCALAPKLFHLRAAAAHYKTPPFSVDPVTYPALARYMAGIFEHPAFLESAVPDETVIWGWGNARGD